MSDLENRDIGEEKNEIPGDDQEVDKPEESPEEVKAYYEPFGKNENTGDGQENFPMRPQGNPENIALFSLVCGIAGFACCGLPAGIAAILLAFMARRRMGRFCGSSIGVLILGIVNVIYSIVVIVLGVILFSYIGDIGEGLETTESVVFSYFLR